MSPVPVFHLEALTGDRWCEGYIHPWFVVSYTARKYLKQIGRVACAMFLAAYFSLGLYFPESKFLLITSLAQTLSCFLDNHKTHSLCFG